MGETLEEFVDRIRGPLVSAVALYCGDRDAAEDVAQEALARAWNRWAQLQDPRAWTFHVAFNLARSRARRLDRERAALRRVQAAAPSPSPDPSESAPPDLVGAIQAAVLALPERQRQAMVLRHFLDLPTAEIARIMGCADGTVRAALHQANTSLRRTLPESLEVTDA